MIIYLKCTYIHHSVIQRLINRGIENLIGPTSKGPSSQNQMNSLPPSISLNFRYSVSGSGPESNGNPNVSEQKQVTRLYISHTQRVWFTPQLRAILPLYRTLLSDMLTHTRPLTTTPATNAVKNPAPTRSAVVAGLDAAGFCADVSPVPALGSP